MEANAKFTESLGKLKAQPLALAKTEQYFVGQDLKALINHCNTFFARVRAVWIQLPIAQSSRNAGQHGSDNRKVCLVNTYFTSPTDVGAQCTLHVNNNLSGYLHVVDPHSLLALVFNSKGGTNTSHVTSFESSTRKSGHDSPEARLVMKSFGYAVPEVFSGGKISADPMILLAIPSWTSFEGEGPMDGFRYKLQTSLDGVVERIRQEAAINISTEGQALAQTCIQDAMTFTLGLIQWMSIFEHLHKAGKVGVKLGVDKSVIMWICLQGRQAVLNFTQEDGFSNHLEVQTVLNKHMRQHRAVMQDELNTHLVALKEEQEEVMKELWSLKSRVDKVPKKA
eukprot:jgi/Psemu1/24891/gm1.24891_g